MAQTATLACPECRILSVLKVPCTALCWHVPWEKFHFLSVLVSSEISWVPAMQHQAWSQSQFPKICLLCQCHWNECETFRQDSLMRNICDCGPGESCLTIGIDSIASVGRSACQVPKTWILDFSLKLNPERHSLKIIDKSFLSRHHFLSSEMGLTQFFQSHSVI